VSGGAGSTVTLAAVGDIMLGEHPVMVGRGVVRRYDAADGAYPFGRVGALLTGADLVFGNLESALTERPPGTNRLARACVGRASAAARLRATGFSLLSLANNHTQQHGEEPFRATEAALAAAEIGAVGLAAGDPRRCRPVDLEVNGVALRFLGYSQRPRQYFRATPLYAEPDEASLLADVAAGVAAGRTVVVSLHWGDELSRVPHVAQVALGRRLVEAGAALVLGHHPHVLQGLERHGTGLIAYSLGNFVFDIDWHARVRDSVVLRCRLAPGRVLDHEWIPVTIGSDFAPEPAAGSRARAIDRFLREAGAALEGRPLAELQQRHDAGYRRELAGALRRYRRAKYRYILRHALDYEPRVFWSILGDYLWHRLRPARG
jgi:poly-gamma-glutamate synthesis protein (capsule biosynthesis protein)